jgi:hypothetical protein
MLGIGSLVFIINDAILLPEGEAGVDWVILGDACERRCDFIFDRFAIFLLFEVELINEILLVLIQSLDVFTCLALFTFELLYNF